MKSFTSFFSIITAIILVGVTMFYLGRQTAPKPHLIAVAAPAKAPAAVAPRLPIEPIRAVTPASAPATAPAPVDAVVSKKTPQELLSTNAALARALGILLQTNLPLQDKMAIWQELRSKGQLDDAIASLKEGAANNPDNATYFTALAEGYYTKLQSVYGSADASTVAILALQADQSFNDALKIDPSSWEAQYVKADALSHWPAEMNKGSEVVQELSSLIDQQEAQSAQPQFAMSYVLLGDEYAKLGQSDYAAATWQLGLQEYPGNATLRNRLTQGHR